MKSEIEGLQAIHSFNYKFGKILQKRGQQRKDIVEDVAHPLVIEIHAPATEDSAALTMPLSTQRALYLSKLALFYIKDKPAAESEKLLTRLYEHAKKPSFRYRHQWREGDFLIWDNFGVMHKGTFTDPEHPRVLNRTTVRVP